MSRDNNSDIRVQWRKKKKNKEMLSKDGNPKNSLLLQCIQTSLSPRKLHTCLSYGVAGVWNNEGRLLFILFSHPEFNWGRLHLGEQYNFIFIIYILLFYCWLFIPRLTSFFLGFVWMITTSSTPEWGQYKYNKNSFLSCTNSNNYWCWICNFVYWTSYLNSPFQFLNNLMYE